jgi:hypothetical protein
MTKVATSGLVRGLVLAIAVCWATACRTTLAGNLVANGGFETGDFTGWTVNTQGWNFTTVTSAVPPASNIFGGGVNYAPVEGNFLAALGTPGINFSPPEEVSQTIATIPGDTYKFSFAYFIGPAGGGDQNNSFSAFFGANNPVNITNDQSFTTDGNGNVIWATYSGVFAATSRSTAVEFFSGNTQWGNGLDAVSVTFVAPEPSSIALISLAGVGLVLAARRRKTARAD